MCVLRDSIGAQLQLALAKSDSEQLARTIAEEQLSEAEKEKTMKGLELREAKSAHKSEIIKRDLNIANVSPPTLPQRITLRGTCFCIDWMAL